MKIKTLNDEMLKRYLLDDVSDEERQEVEERFLEDDLLFEEMNALEDELFFDYRQNRLNLKESAAFERKFLRAPQEKEKAAFAGAFLQMTAELAGEKVEKAPPVSFWQPLADFFKSFGSPLQLGMAAASILLILGISWLFYQNLQMRGELAILQNNRAEEAQRQEEIIAEKQNRQSELEQQLLAEKEKAEQNERQIQEIEQERANLQEEIDELKRQNTKTPSGSLPQPGVTPAPQPPRSIVALVLSPGMFSRGGGAGMERIALSGSAKSLRINLRLETQNQYQSYRARVLSVSEGTEIWTSAALKPQGKGAKKSVTFIISANLLNRADYEISLIGVNENGGTEEIDTYYFSVLK